MVFGPYTTMKVNTIQFLANASHMMSNIFIPIFARSLGASFFEVGVIAACFSLATFVSSFIFGKAADINRLRPIVLVGLLMSAIAFLLQVFANDTLSLAAIRALVGFCMGIYPAALTVYVYYQKESIGKFSSFGSLGWMAGFLVAGFVGDIKYLFIISSFFYCISFLAALQLKDVEKPSLKVSYFSLKTFRKNIATYLSVFVRHTGAAGVWAILPLYLTFLGASGVWIGLIYAINPFLQFLIMRRLDRFGNEWLMKWGFIMSGLAFFGYFMSPNYVFIIPGMVFVAFGWSFLFVGASQLLMERSDEKATATGILNSVIAASNIVGAILGGAMLQLYGFKETMVFAVLCSIAGVIIFKILDRPFLQSTA
ncbi:MFS transporter [Methanolobus mangrovi]|uniref:MFS transporter n=1 Tax=Methanolobus mangrovi TaxID=3072977 RepID=A0AA51UDY3_9EURY|nr:MFS transporter [Methanolobus mangrovi]WMW21203.1 MFS transporter [Methanolobus mangrovi]